MFEVDSWWALFQKVYTVGMNRCNGGYYNAATGTLSAWEDMGP